MNPYRNEPRYVHTCEGGSCGGCRRAAWDEGYKAGQQAEKERVRPIVQAAIQTWETLEAADGVAVAEGLGGAGKLALKAAKRWMQKVSWEKA